MRVMVFVMANEDTEAGNMPTEAGLAAMMKFNEELVKAGVLLDGAGLHATSRAKRIRFDGSTRTVTDGPFAESKELIAGYSMWQVASMDEALAWAERAPFGGDRDVEVTLRPVFGPEDFGPELTPELREQEERLRAESARRQQP